MKFIEVRFYPNINYFHINRIKIDYTSNKLKKRKSKQENLYDSLCEKYVEPPYFKK